VASARKSSTPASRAIAAAVRALSPVIITVRMPIARSWSKRSVMPGFTVSFSRMTPRIFGASPSRWSVTTSGVAPSLETPSTSGPSSSGTAPPASATIRRTLSAAPLRTERGPAPSEGGKSIPLIRVWAVNGTITASRADGSTRP
jgi:hypothetical protein